MLRILIFIFGLLSIFEAHSDSSSLEELRSLPYLAWSEKSDHRQSGVVKYDKNKAFDGYNFYTDEWKNAYLMDMAGHIIYRWKLPSHRGTLQYVKLLKDGDILAAVDAIGFVKMDKNSRIMWVTPILAHHDMEMLSDGTFLAVAMDLPIRYNDRCVSFDLIAHVSKDGKILDKWSTFDHLKSLQKLHFPSLLDTPERDSVNKKSLKQTTDNTQEPDFFMVNLHRDNEVINIKGDHCTARNYREWYTYYHLNSIQVLSNTDLGLKDRRFQKGNWLIGFRNVDLICILDKDTHQVVWSWGSGILDGPHSPKMLNNGNILVFDNGFHRSYSRLIIIDPESNKIVWEYKANPPQNFYTKEAGSGQLLENGNFLICEGLKGHTFEITPHGEIVWEFFNPMVNKDGRRKNIYRMVRIQKGNVSDWIKNNGHL